ncbi:DUF2254 domain-containing protein [Caulobacter sp. NIBR1757]|uniref:DUF2254 domain-containing protein n=1 Tax=Caulobacter sp. NIBR1757 TaxID=3016000 RepID=UPI0022F002C8|nr:DUF2254 domain-containing protein [Caulobacter sp. NIBR1757]WGM41064.1 hypothetical protein AMEJIAPC_04012 [Caulobacter sp. NIBR1757]
MYRWLFVWRKLARRVWFRVGLYGLAGVGAALLAALLGRFVPSAMSERLGGPNVEGLLTILANSLLAVSIFGAGAMVTAYTSVSGSITPRAAGLVTTDKRLQGALSTFVGGFLYAIVALTALSSSYYGKDGRTIVYIITLIVVGLVAINILLLIDRLARLARVDFIVERIEQETTKAFHRRVEWEATTCAPPRGLPVPQTRVVSDRVARVQNIDVSALGRIAEEQGVRLQIVALPGAMVGLEQPLLNIFDGGVDEDVCKELRSAFTLGDGRSFDQDPRHGLIVLGEIAARALSPGVNDPGTAIAVVRSGVALLSSWDQLNAERKNEEAPDLRVFADRLSPADLIDDVFHPIARYGAGDVAVYQWLHKGMHLLERLKMPGMAPAARNFSTDALARAKVSMAHAGDMKRLAASARAPTA